MALSGSWDISATRTIIVEAALRKLGVLAEGQTANSNAVTIAAEALNFMIKSWQAEGMPVWYLKTGFIYPIENDENLSLGPGGDHWSEELILTKLTNNATSGTSTITISITAATDVVGTIADSDNIGIEMDDGSIHWTTVSAGGGTATLTLTAATDDTANSSNRVFAYTTKAQRPLSVEGAWRVDAVTADRVDISPVSMSEMLSQTNPTDEGVPLMYNYQGTLTTGSFRYWPRFQNGDTYIELLFQHPFDDIDAATNNPAFPDEWIEALIYGLAVRLAPEYALPLQERILLKGEAQTMKDRALLSTDEDSSIQIQPAMLNG